jgi:serine/threonine protein kinase
MDLRATLQQSLGDDFSIERELGGGGMSRVFVVREESLGRDVVLKVLSPELAQGLSAERFTRGELRGVWRSIGCWRTWLHLSVLASPIHFSPCAN